MKLTRQMAAGFINLGIQQRIHELEGQIAELRQLLKGTNARGPYKKKKTKRYTAAQRQEISERMKRMWMKKSKQRRLQQSKLMIAAKNGKQTA